MCVVLIIPTVTDPDASLLVVGPEERLADYLIILHGVERTRSF